MYRAQERLDTLTEDEETGLRRERLRLKDEIARRLGLTATRWPGGRLGVAPGAMAGASNQREGTDAVHSG